MRVPVWWAALSLAPQCYSEHGRVSCVWIRFGSSRQYYFVDLKYDAATVARCGVLEHLRLTFVLCFAVGCSEQQKHNACVGISRMLEFGKKSPSTE